VITVGGREVVEVERVGELPQLEPAVTRHKPQLRLGFELVGAASHLGPEVVVDLPRGEHADDDGEAAQDHER
jgi:hypothetical protein